jgi:hypothetical protein
VKLLTLMSLNPVSVMFTCQPVLQDAECAECAHCPDVDVYVRSVAVQHPGSRDKEMNGPTIKV